MRFAVWCAAHDDSPCNEGVLLIRKDGGLWCPACKIHPDSQSMCLVACCPDHRIKLNNLVCPECGEEFALPASAQSARAGEADDDLEELIGDRGDSEDLF